MASVTFSTIDRLSKDTSISVQAIDAVLEADVDALAAAIQAIILGATLKAVKSIDTTLQAGSLVPPANEDANRGDKWLFRTQDNVNGKVFKNEIGTADSSALPGPTSDFIDLSAGLGLAVKTAWETVYRSPYGNAGTLLSIQQITRTDN